MQKLDGTKLVYHVEALARWKRGEVVYPIQIEISPTRVCNHKCLFCYYEYTARGPVQLDKGVWTKLLDDSRALGTKAIFYSGEGEPLLNKHTPEMIEYGAKLGFDQALNTNATPLRANVVEQVMPHLEWMRVSVNGVDPEDYARAHVAPAGHFELAMTNIAGAVEFKRANGLKCTIGIQLVYTGQSVESLLEFGRRIRDIGADYFSVKPGMPHPDNPVRLDHHFPTPEEFSQITELGRPGFQVAVRWGLQEQDWRRPYKRCLSLPFFAEVTADGKVYACGPHLNEDNFCYGSLHEMDLKTMWSHENRAKVETHVCGIADLDTVCMPLCRLDQVNRYLWEIENPPPSVNFI